MRDYLSTIAGNPLGGFLIALAGLATLLGAGPALASETDLLLPDFAGVQFGGIEARTLLTAGIGVCLLGGAFGMGMFLSLRRLPVHKSMGEVSELIYETCKAYLIIQGRFILFLELFIGAIMVIYFGWLRHLDTARVVIIVLFSLVGIAGSYGVAWFGILINTRANSRTAFASLSGRAYPTYAIPIRAGMSIGMVLISVELIIMLGILLYVPRDYAGACFIGFAIGESLAAAALRIAGGIFTKIADIGADLMKIVFNIKEDDARNPGVIADCTGDNAGDSIGPSADGFETYGVTGVALITFILLAVTAPDVQVRLLVWIFLMRIMMVITSALAFAVNQAVWGARCGDAEEMDFELPLTSLVWVTSLLSTGMTFLVSYLTITELGDGTLWWKLSTIISCGTIAGALIPEVVKVFTSTESGHVREVVTAAREGGASLGVLSGLVSGNFSAYWIGMVILALMTTAFVVSTFGLDQLMMAPAVFAFGLVAFGFLGMGPVTIAVDSYGPVTDNAQSVYELSTIETIPGIERDLEREFGFKPDFRKAKRLLEANDGAGNTFKATAKPVLVGTAAVGATTLIFSIVVILTHGLTKDLEKLSLLHPPFLLGLIAGGAVIYWFTGAAIQAVSTGAYRAVEFIKANIRLDGTATKASVADSRRVVEICTQYAQKGTLNIFLTVFCTTLAFACLDPYFFIGYLISIANFGMYQAIFMANAGGAWDNAKKVVEVELQEKGTALHAATVVGDTVGDPFKDTSSVAMNPIIKFSTLFGLLALELALELEPGFSKMIGFTFLAISFVFVWRSFYGMRIPAAGHAGFAGAVPVTSKAGAK